MTAFKTLLMRFMLTSLALMTQLSFGEDAPITAIQNLSNETFTEADTVTQDQNVLINRECKQLLSKGLDLEKAYNIAVIGEINVGKSTFINGMRGVVYGDPTFADVCCGVACISDIKKSVFSVTVPHVSWWDFPGIGSGYRSSSLSSNYFEDNCLHLFDRIMFVYNGRLNMFGEYLFTKAMTLFALDKIAVVYSRTGENVRSLMREFEMTELEAESHLRKSVTKRLRTDLTILLGPFGFSVPLFFVCTHTWEDTKQAKYDEKVLLVDYLVRLTL